MAQKTTHEKPSEAGKKVGERPHGYRKEEEKGSKGRGREMTTEEAGRMGGEKTSETHGREFYQEIGHKGGEKTAETHGKEFYQSIGKKGGEAVSEARGPEFYKEIGHKGGEAVSEARGPEFYKEIGHKGGEAQPREAKARGGEHSHKHD